jgi:hypothetical protein
MFVGESDDTWKLQGGHGENWIAHFAQIRRG